jgi:hypothetical protein
LIYRLIAPSWLSKPVLEGKFTDEEIIKYNSEGYNIYYLPNYPTTYKRGASITGADIDAFSWVFVDYDVKSGTYLGKDEFLEAIGQSGISPTKIVDSGNGIHVYWKIVNLDAMSYLRFQRRLIRLFNTDEAVGQLFQLMRKEGTWNTKVQGSYVKCVQLYEENVQYVAEELDKLLPAITLADEIYCKQHFDKTHGLYFTQEINDALPARFGKFLSDSPEAKELWSEPSDDRSKADYRLGHLMLAYGFTKDEAASVLVNSAKALQRAPTHRNSYASNIVDKIWTNQLEHVPVDDTVEAILNRSGNSPKGIRFPCHKFLDDTVHGFRLGQVIGIIGGTGVGKTTLTLNAFLWFAQANPDFHHFFFSLEQPEEEIAARINTICQGNTALFSKIHVVSNYDQNGVFKNLSMDGVEEHLQAFKTRTNQQVGAAVVDHIGVLSKSDKNGEMEGLMGVCKKMKATAQSVNCMLIMLSQAPREKAGIGDLELDKSAAYGTVFFESYVDYAICLWQPLKRVYNEGAPTVMAFKYAKIRHKKQGFDHIQEDTCYQLFFDPQTELLRELTHDEEVAAKFFLNKATNARKLDRKTDIVKYESRRANDSAEADSNQQH